MPYDPVMAAHDSPLAAALERVGDRWSLLLVEALLPGPRRFNELGEAVTGIAPNILADRLRRLESERIVSATPYSERPPRFVYELTAAGRELAGALRMLADWGARHREGADPPRHWFVADFVWAQEPYRVRRRARLPVYLVPAGGASLAGRAAG